jgi:hypothetical protein
VAALHVNGDGTAENIMIGSSSSRSAGESRNAGGVTCPTTRTNAKGFGST